jgi:hypothetical protein
VGIQGDGTWLAYYNYQFGDVNRFAANIATRRSGDHIEVRLDDVSGTLVADMKTLPTLSGDPSDDQELIDPTSYKRQNTKLLTSVSG